MKPVIMDFEKLDLLQPVGDTMAFDLEGNFFMKLSDTMAVDMKTGKLHILSKWPKDDEEE